MPPVNLSVKKVPDKVVRTLRERARRNHRSLQGELMSILENAAATEPRLAAGAGRVREPAAPFGAEDRDRDPVAPRKQPARVPLSNRAVPNLDVSKDELAEFCRRHHIRRLSFFGSVLRDDFGPASDVDVLLEFEPDHMVGFGIFDVESDLSQLVGGRKVDIHNPKYLNRHLKDRILSSARPAYAAAG